MRPATQAIWRTVFDIRAAPAGAGNKLCDGAKGATTTKARPFRPCALTSGSSVGGDIRDASPGVKHWLDSLPSSAARAQGDGGGGQKVPRHLMHRQHNPRLRAKDAILCSRRHHTRNDVEPPEFYKRPTNINRHIWDYFVEPMSNSFVISGLTEKRMELSGAIREVEKQLAQLQSGLLCSRVDRCECMRSSAPRYYPNL